MSKQQIEKKLYKFAMIILRKVGQDNYISLCDIESIRDNLMASKGCTVEDIMLLNQFTHELTALSLYKYENNDYHYMVSERTLGEFKDNILERY